MTENLIQLKAKIDTMEVKENDVNHNQGTFSSQPQIIPKNIFHEDNHASFSLEENHVISNLNGKSSFNPCEVYFEDNMEQKEKIMMISFWRMLIQWRPMNLFI